MAGECVLSEKSEGVAILTMPPVAVIQEIEPKLMMEPPPRRFIWSTTAWAAKN